VADVGEAFNFLAGRLEVLLSAERESVADLSHRLRTPMTTLRLQAETLSDPVEAAALIADIDALERAIDRLITEARRPSGAEDVPYRAADLAETVQHRASFWQVLADEQGRPTSLLIEPGEYPVAISSAELGALVDTLIENVFTHTGNGIGYILRVRKLADGRSSLTVQDEGSGFADLNVLRRGESSRGGTGLGLDIVAKAAERSGGGFRIGNAPGGGAEVVVAFGLPAPPEVAPSDPEDEPVEEPSAPVLG
ncbi:MAG: sensor histidine kinase, partial [Planctomycetota bacterium]|jgi:signal transduction histidine kinase